LTARPSRVRSSILSSKMVMSFQIPKWFLKFWRCGLAESPHWAPHLATLAQRLQVIEAPP
jgi:hypothetical protein